MTTVPKFRGYLGTSNAGTATIAVAVPTDSTAPLVGDEMTIVLVFTSASSVTGVPSGWTQLLAATAMGTRYLAVYRRTRASGDANTVTFTLNTTGAASGYLFYGAAVFGGLVGSYLRTSTGNVQTTPGVTTTVANSLAISIQGEATAAVETYDNISVASPFVKHSWYLQSGSSPINSVLLATREMPTAGATGDATSTWLKSDGTTNSSGNRGAIMVVWEPVPDAAPAPIKRLPVKVVDETGTLINAGASYWDGSKEIEIAQVIPIHGGMFVPDLLNPTGRIWWMAHRGGSADYQEHCTRGYLQCAIAHADVLEMSLVRSSDGVFFGAHDETADRTSSSVRGQNWKFSEHTAAEIEALVQDLPNRGDTRFSTAPYMRLTELVNTWSKSHSIMLDPKYINTAGRADLYNYIKTIPDYQNRILGKFYHTGIAIANEFHAIGCKVWGYSYTADVGTFNTSDTTDPNRTFTVRPATDSSSTAATIGYWDFTGLEWNAEDAVWAAMIQLSGSKKVLAHICPTAAAAAEGVRKKARALQVSGVNSVSTVF